MADVDTGELRKMSHDWAHPNMAAYDVAGALRQAADEIDRLRSRDTVYAYGERDDAVIEMQKIRRQRDVIVSLVHSLLSEDGVKDSLSHLSVFHILLEKLTSR